MAVVQIKISVSDLDDVLEYFDKIKVYRSAAIDGSYGEITDSLTRLTIESGTTIYEYTDTAGDPDYYYKTSYYNSTTTLESSLSEAQKGEGVPALDLISVEELKTYYLFGLDLTNDSGEEYPDSLYEHFIKSAVSWIETRLDIPIVPLTIEDEKQDWYRDDYEKFMFFETNKYPIISVEEVKLVLPGNQVIHDFDSEWFQVKKEAGHIQLVPGPGSVGTILIGRGAFWPLMHGYGKFIPNAWQIKYTAGFETVPPILKDLIGKTASFGPLNIAGDLLGGAGIASQSIGIDGLNTTFNTTSSSTSAGYGARLLQYQKEIKEVIPTLSRYYKGLRLKVA